MILIKDTNIQEYFSDFYINNKLLMKKFKFFNEDYTISEKDGIIFVENILNTDFHNYLKNQFDGKKYKSKNVLFRKATGINFLDLHKEKDLNGFLNIFYSNQFLDILSDLIKKPIQRPPLLDNNACSLLIYDNPGDFISWHKDTTRYYGDRYVVLLSIINENQEKECCSSSEFQYKINDQIYSIKLKPNNMMIFKGSEILHQATEISKNERRILLSMTFGDICEPIMNIFTELDYKMKNFFLYK